MQQQVAHNHNGLVYNQIESPLSAFNNFMVQITERLDKIIYPNNYTGINQLTAKNQIIFDNSSIMLMNLFKLSLFNNKLHIKVLRPLCCSEFKVLNVLTENFSIIESCYYQYLMMYNKIASNCDEVPYQLVNGLIETLEDPTKEISKFYLIPFKTKVQHLYDAKASGDVLSKLVNRYTYVINFKRNKKAAQFSYKIYRMLSSELSQSKSLDNVDFINEEVIKQDTLSMPLLKRFVEQLFYYGEIIVS